MSLKVGIVGLPNVGKSTLFKALTGHAVEIANYPFATIDPNVGVVAVPDERLLQLAALSSSIRVIPASIEFVDIAGLVKGASHGEGLGNKFLAAIRETDAISEVVRVFDDADIIHVAGGADAISDINTVTYELILKDLETVAQRLRSVTKESKSGLKEALIEEAMLASVERDLSAGIPASKHLLALDESRRREAEKALMSIGLLTAKPVIYVFNMSDETVSSWSPDAKLTATIDGAPWVAVAARAEADIADLSPSEQTEYLTTSGIKERGLDALIRIGYRALGLMTFFTTGEKETRAWTIRDGATAPEAGAAIHSDFRDKFIRADVIQWNKLLEAGSWTVARERGWLRTEGKTYVVKDGDVIEFKI